MAGLRDLQSLGLLALLTLSLPLSAYAQPGATPSPLIPEWCEITVANGNRPIGETTPPGTWYGENGLYTNVFADGIHPVVKSNDGHGGSDKRGWYRDVPGDPLTIEIGFVGASSTTGPPKVDIPDGYEQTRFQASVFWYPEEGCWVTTASTASSTIQITEWVMFINDPSATPQGS